MAPAKKAKKTSAKKPAKKAAASPAPKKRLTPAEYAWSSFDDMLAADADEVRDGADHRVYLERGREVAVLTRKGDELVLDFAAPDMGEFAKVKAYYTPTPKRRGWLRYRRPATRDPRPDLEADIGSILGTAWRERNPPPSFRSIASAGGPYVCMQLSNVSSWGGACDADEFPEEAALYKKALKGPDTASILTLGDGAWALVLGTPDPLFAKVTAKGGLFARAVSHSMSDEALEKVLATAPDDGWKKVGKVAVKEHVRAFDVAEFGGAIGEGNSVTLSLAPGSYEIATRTWQPDDETELLLTRFRSF